MERNDLARFTNVSRARGPDGMGLLIDAVAGLGLGHRRLSILDPSPSGAQPFVSACGRYVVVFNGEIYNFLELRRTLEKKGHAFRTDSDTEVLLAAWREWGEDCQSRFDGMWAFAVWDRQERRLFVSRDRFGVKPVFYYYDGRHFAISSDIKAFFLLPCFGGGLDLLGYGLCFSNPSYYAASELTVLANVRRLGPGCCMTVPETGEPTIRRWWVSINHLLEVPETWEEQVERFRELFFRAVKLRMRSDVPIGATLSGGTDSGSIVCAMAELASRGGLSTNRMTRDWQHVFTASYPGTEVDELAAAKVVAEHCLCGQRTVEIAPIADLDEFDAILADLEGVHWNLPTGPWRIYRAMRSEGLRVSLDGHGADEALGGYHRHLRAALHDAVIPRLRPRLLARTRRLAREMGEKVSWREMLFPSSSEEAVHLFPEQRREVNSLGGGMLNQWLYEEIHFTHLPLLLHNFDRMSMAHGVEVRSPFMDWRLLCYVMALPGEAKIGAGFTKRILRAAMVDVLPESTRVSRNKVGFSGPSSWWMEEAGNYALEALADPEFAQCPLFNGRDLRKRYQQAYKEGDEAGAPPITRHLMAVRLKRVMKAQAESRGTPETEGPVAVV